MCFTIASPSPVPREARARSARKKRSKSRVSSVSWTPTPSSVPADDHRAVLVLDRERERRARARVADRVLGEVLRDDAHHARPDRELDPRVALDGERDAGAARALLELGGHRLELRPDGDGAERDDARTRTRAR